VTVNDVDVRNEQTRITFTDKETNDRQKVMLEDVNTPNQYTESTSEGVEVKHQRNAERKNDETKSDLSRTSGKLKLNLNGEQIDNQKEQTVVREDLGEIHTDSRTNDRGRGGDASKKQNQASTSGMNDTNEKLEPIVLYAAEPLLPLSEACAPLANILHNLSFYVQMALDETPEKPPDGLSVDESAAIRLYTIEWDKPHRSLYSMLNYTLKECDREDLVPYFKYLKLFLTALVKLPCVPPLTVWRGVTKNLSDEFAPGTPVTWWAFSSTTTQLTVLENNMYLGNTGDRTLFSVEAINGRTVRAHSHFVTEDEILLFPGTHMIVQSQFSPAPELHIIHLKQVIPEVVLLEPPFEGMLNIFKHSF
jgi:hypothetical protein